MIHRIVTSSLCALLLAGAVFAQAPQAGVDYPSPIPVPFIGFTTGTSDPELCYPGLSPNNFRTDLGLMKICTSRNTWSVNLSANVPPQPATAGSTTVGTAALPFSSLFLGSAATDNLQLTTAGFTGAYAFTFCEPGASTRAFCIADPADSTKNFLVDVSGNTTGKNSTLAFADTSTRVFTFPEPGGAASVAYINPTNTQNIANTGTFQNTGVITPTGGIAQSPATVPYTAFTTFAGGIASTSVTDIIQEWYSQIFVPANTTLTGACFLTGTSVGTDKAITILWSQAGAILANSNTTGSTITGNSNYQCIAFTGTVPVTGPASYFVGIQGSGTHATEINTYPAASAPSTYITGVQAAGVFGTLAAIATPATSFTAGDGPVMWVY